MGWFTGRAILVGPEEEPIRSKAVNGGHADLAEGSTGAHHGRVRCTAAYLALPHAVVDAFDAFNRLYDLWLMDTAPDCTALRFLLDDRRPIWNPARATRGA